MRSQAGWFHVVVDVVSLLTPHGDTTKTLGPIPIAPIIRWPVRVMSAGPSGSGQKGKREEQENGATVRKMYCTVTMVGGVLYDVIPYLEWQGPKRLEDPRPVP
jgi:hypothetical protein